jgi:predicted helicase
MRQHLEHDFDAIYILDMGGNVRKNPKLSGTTHNVFGIQIGVAIGFFIRRKRANGKKDERQAEIYYAKTGEDWRKEAKYRFLDDTGSVSGVQWQRIQPDARFTWLTEGSRGEFSEFLAIETIFDLFSNGAMSNSDSYVYGFSQSSLIARANRMVSAYNTELNRWRTAGCPNPIDSFIRVDEKDLKWVRKTRRSLLRGIEAHYRDLSLRPSLYRPFTRQYHYFDRIFNEDLYQLEKIFPQIKPEQRVICCTDKGSEKPFMCIIASEIPDRHLVGAGSGTQCFPLYSYDKDGTNRHDNITDLSLAEFRRHYGDDSITKWSIFHYVYGLLHHPNYRHRYEANLKRELPRIPFAPDFWGFAHAGERLAQLHLDYEQQPEWPLRFIENPGTPLSWRVEKMKLSRDKAAIVYNEFLTLADIPEDTFSYRLGNRSALEWVLDQYQVSTDKRSGITNDPNRPDDPQYIVRLIGQVITVSIETMKIVHALPPLGETDSASAVVSSPEPAAIPVSDTAAPPPSVSSIDEPTRKKPSTSRQAPAQTPRKGPKKPASD